MWPWLLLAAVLVALVLRQGLIAYARPGGALDLLRMPRRVMQTCATTAGVPAKVRANVARFAPGFEHVVLDDAAALAFLEAHYGDEVVRAFRGLRVGAHKADLLRYCLLYVHGGVYLDIKTELTEPLEGLFYARPDVDLYVVLQHDGLGIYNGVIAAKPGNALFLQLVREMLPLCARDVPYHTFVWQFLEVLRRGLREPLRCGAALRSHWGTVYVLREGCTQRAADCHDGLDRYGLCCHIHDGDRRAVKVRYSDYPWTRDARAEEG
jgi:hypothetical protein